MTGTEPTDTPQSSQMACRELSVRLRGNTANTVTIRVDSTTFYEESQLLECDLGATPLVYIYRVRTQ